MRLKTALAAMLAVLALPARTGWSDDWPQWRGPGRDAAWPATGILEEFPPAGLKVCWRAVVGPGWSSPVVAGGRVYLTDAELKSPDARERVLCLEEATGKPLWTHSYEVAYPDWAFTQGPGRGPTATPIVDGGRLYAVGLMGDLICFDAATADVLWKKDLQQEYGIQEFSTNASPLIEGDLLILFIGSAIAKSEACVIALDKTSGKEVWKALNETVTACSPIVITHRGKRQLIVRTAESVTSLDPANGRLHWREAFKAENAVATPVFHKNLLLAGGVMLKLEADQDAPTVLSPARRAAAAASLSNTSTALLHGDLAVSARSSGEFVCLAAMTGEQLWETDRVTDVRPGASIHVTAVGDVALLYTDRGELIRARLTETGYTEQSRARLLEPTTPFSGRNVAWPPPAYANRRIYVRNDKELICASLAAE
jgi:outer membrane protein assembly factor BamB